MRSFEEIKNIPSFPGIYAFKGAYDRREEYSYVGMTNNLKERVSQHLIKKDSSIVTGSSTISLNPDKICECHWWIHKKFEDKRLRSIAEQIAFDLLKPTLRSRGHSVEDKVENVFKQEMIDLFKGIPSGYATFYNLDWAVRKIRELEKEIILLKQNIFKN